MMPLDPAIGRVYSQCDYNADVECSRMKKVLFAMAVCLMVFPAATRGAAFRPQTVQEAVAFPGDDFYRVFCSLEGMLGQWGDPPLGGNVKRLAITQFAAHNDAMGFPETDGDETVIFRTEIVFAESGEQISETRDRRGDGSDIMHNRREGDTLFHAPLGEAGDTFLYVTVRDGEGRPLREELYRRDESGDALIRVEANYSYDDAARTVTNVNSLGQMAVFSYDKRGKILREAWSGTEGKDTLFSVYSAEYDEAGRPTLYREESFSPGSPDHRVHETRFIYDGAGRLTEKRHSSTIGGATAEREPERFEYDDEGRITSYRRGGFTVARIFDSRGHLIQIDRNVPSEIGLPLMERIFFVNDDDGNWTRATLISPHRPAVIEREITYY